ncbi:GDSL esterase/lipase At1g28590-like isoform X2 [Rutidosis leptorrhynchoides]|uniref:GDSL esterase/lipase At1g28590-like isoform X2 n=1 Tax=Rutidosis leptorrhynchoides TaxID=125765 RepID=UPI003A9A6449
MSFACFLVVLIVFSNDRLVHASGCYTSIISFGDSLADTGNLKGLATIADELYPCLLPPYGESFANQPTGRCSNGRLIIDFLAFEQGVNYAVAGATALSASFLEAKWTEKSVNNASLQTQLSWFQKSLPSICGNTSACRDYIGRSLFLIGEIGGNDYNYPLLVGKPIEEAESYVPLVIDTIFSTINEVIDMGAQTLVVPGNFPIGCSSSYLTTRAFLNEERDPSTGCLIQLNEFAEYHNQMLQSRLNEIRELHPNVIIMYGDYFNAAMQFYRSPPEFGFTNGVLKACCGGGGPYNYNTEARCGYEPATACDEPDTYANWDGVHLTEAAYKVIFKGLFEGTFTKPEFRSVCHASESQVNIGSSSAM